MKKIILAVAVGIVIGWVLHKPVIPSFDIDNDPRGCVIYWDDGTISAKSRVMYLGDLQPGEKKKLKLFN